MVFKWNGHEVSVSPKIIRLVAAIVLTTAIGGTGASFWDSIRPVLASDLVPLWRAASMQVDDEIRQTRRSIREIEADIVEQRAQAKPVPNDWFEELDNEKDYLELLREQRKEIREKLK